MNNLYSTIDNLCRSKGIKPAKMCTDIGISQGIISDLKYGRKNSISSETALRIANYFDVTVNYLLGDEKEKPALNAQGGDDPLQQELDSLLPLLNRDQKKLVVAQIRFLLSDKPE